jgi:hypothetical protein
VIWIGRGAEFDRDAVKSILDPERGQSPVEVSEALMVGAVERIHQASVWPLHRSVPPRQIDAVTAYQERDDLAGIVVERSIH